jgi:predicted RNA binding protein YcfA (HicA-like mRNA interferase family)
MKVRKAKDLIKVLKKKGFQLYPEKHHHQFYYLTIGGIKYNVYTYFSHGIDEYGHNLMSEIRKQLYFKKTIDMEQFFDCPMTKEKYVTHLKEQKIISFEN